MQTVFVGPIGLVLVRGVGGGGGGEGRGEMRLVLTSKKRNERREHVLWTAKDAPRSRRIYVMITPLDVRLLKIIVTHKNQDC